MKRRRRLTAEEQALWSGVVRAITPLRSRPQSSLPAPAGNDKHSGSASGRDELATPARPGASPAAVKPPPLANFERRLKQRVARGRAPIDARIDLHGLTQAEAHSALLRFLRRAQAGGGRIVLVVTGKGGGSAGRNSEPGVLKRQVPLWLSLPEFRHLIVGFEVADVGHGGQGALYVRVRRPR